MLILDGLGWSTATMDEKVDVETWKTPADESSLHWAIVGIFRLWACNENGLQLAIQGAAADMGRGAGHNVIQQAEAPKYEGQVSLKALTVGREVTMISQFTVQLDSPNRDFARKLVPAEGSCGGPSVNLNPRIQGKLEGARSTESTASAEKPPGFYAVLEEKGTTRRQGVAGPLRNRSPVFSTQPHPQRITISPLLPSLRIDEREAPLHVYRRCG